MSLSKRDPGQILQAAFDDASQRIKVDAEITANISGAQEIIINAPGDNIAISDGTNIAGVTPSNELKVNIGVTTGQKTSPNCLPVVIASDQSPVPVSFSGSITATNPSVGVDGSTAPTSSTLVGGIDNSGKLQGVKVNASGELLVDNSSNVQPVSASTLPLPTGASTSANQATANTSLSSIDSKLTDTANGLKVDGSGVTQPVSGTISVSNFPATQAVTQSTSPWVISGQSAVGTLPANNPVSVSGVDGGGLKRSLLLDSTGKIEVDSISGTVSLPSGASTSANQTTANTSLASIDSKLTDTANGLKIDGSGVVQPVSGTVSVNQGTSPWVVSQPSNRTATGTLSVATPDGSINSAAAGSTVQIATDGSSTVALQTSGNWVGALAFDVSYDGGTTWNKTQSIDASIASSSNLNKIFQGWENNLNADPWILNCAGSTTARIRMVSLSSGTATINLVASSGTYYVVPTQSNPNSNQVAANLASKKSYVSNTGPITGATSTGVKSLAYLWHPSTVTARYQITSINVNQIAGVGVAGGQRIELNRITAENGTPGGSTATINPKDADDAASGATIRIAPTGAPTRLSGVLFGGDVPVQLNGNILAPGGNGTESIECKPFVMRVSQNEGYEIVQNVITTLTTAPTFNISFEWTEVS